MCRFRLIFIFNYYTTLFMCFQGIKETILVQKKKQQLSCQKLSFLFGGAEWFGCRKFLVDMQTSFARYIYSVNSICFCFAKTRYDINLVAARQHIECVSTYRVIYDISKILQEIYIDEKKTFFFVEKCLFFWWIFSLALKKLPVASFYSKSPCPRSGV